MNEKQPDTIFYTVDTASEGQRLDIYLSHEIEGISRAQIQKLISEGKVEFNGKSVSKKEKVFAGARIKVSGLGFTRQSELEPQEIPLDILFEDEYFLAVNKPAGMVVHPGNGVKNGTLVNALLFRSSELSNGSAEDRPGIVHRLDKDTSGVLIVAKNNPAHYALASAFQNRTIEKHYIGFCIGMPREDHSKIELALDRSRNDPLKRAPSRDGKSAVTEYWLIEHRSGISAMHFRPHTGRTHQIRVHCSSAGFPILADALYGGGRERLQRINPLERPAAFLIFKCFARQALHAYMLQFEHPFTGKLMKICAPIPDDFWRAAAILGNRDLFKYLVL